MSTVLEACDNSDSERWDPVSGKAPGFPDYCMSSTLVTMMLDGLTTRRQLKRREWKPADKEQ